MSAPAVPSVYLILAQAFVKSLVAEVPVAGNFGIFVKEGLAARREAAFTQSFLATEEDLDRLLETVRTNPYFAALLARVVEQARSALTDEKAIAFGLLLRDLVRESETVPGEELELLLLALADLERPHVRALAQLEAFETDEQLEASGVDLKTSDERQERLHFTEEKMAMPVSATLVRHGLVSQTAGFGLYVNGISDFGRKMLLYVREAGGVE